MGASRQGLVHLVPVFTAALIFTFDGVGTGRAQNSVLSNDTRTAKYIARDYSFTGPDHVQAGLVTIEIENQGNDLHQLQLLKLPAGKSAEDFATAIAVDHKRLPRWIQRRGGPNSVVPRDQGIATVKLEAGEYVAICGIPDSRGIPHVALGMMKSLHVEESTTGPAEVPHAALDVIEEDFLFQFPRRVKSGEHTIHVINKGSQAHEVVVIQLAPGASVADFAEGFRPGVAILPAGKPVGGLVGLDPGGDGYFHIHLQSGNYGLICFLPDLIRGLPHFARGMMFDFSAE